MVTDFLARCDVIEECYEFLLGYAAQGLPSDDGGPAGREVRRHLERAREALIDLAESCRQAIAEHPPALETKYDAFCSMLDRDGKDSLAAIDLVLAQTALSSQLIDNLNASSHLRALLTDLFLVGEIMRTRDHVTPAAD
jgi:hypothetical protein